MAKTEKTKKKIFDGQKQIVPTLELEKGDVFTGTFDGYIELADKDTGEVKHGWARFIDPKSKAVKIPLSFQLALVPFEGGVEYEITCTGKEGRMKLFDVCV